MTVITPSQAFSSSHELIQTLKWFESLQRLNELMRTWKCPIHENFCTQWSNEICVRLQVAPKFQRRTYVKRNAATEFSTIWRRTPKRLLFNTEQIIWRRFAGHLFKCLKYASVGLRSRMASQFSSSNLQVYLYFGISFSCRYTYCTLYRPTSPELSEQAAVKWIHGNCQLLVPWRRSLRRGSRRKHRLRSWRNVDAVVSDDLRSPFNLRYI